MEGPFSIARISFFDEAHRFVTELHRVEELEEFVLWRLCATPCGVDNLSHSTEQRHEEGDLSPHVSHHLPPITSCATALPVLSIHRYQKSW